MTMRSLARAVVATLFAIAIASTIGLAQSANDPALELRLKRAWALSAVFGDHGGSALDVIWRRRY